jgi:hypothetical protein
MNKDLGCSRGDRDDVVAGRPSWCVIIAEASKQIMLRLEERKLRHSRTGGKSPKLFL